MKKKQGRQGREDDLLIYQSLKSQYAICGCAFAIDYSKHIALQGACTFNTCAQLIIECFRYRSTLEFPLLDSFPAIFSQPQQSSTTAVRASLSTTSGVSRHVKTLQKVVSRTVNLEEREALSNGLGEISEAYENGWQSGSEDESDE